MVFCSLSAPLSLTADHPGRVEVRPVGVIAEGVGLHHHLGGHQVGGQGIGVRALGDKNVWSKSQISLLHLLIIFTSVRPHPATVQICPSVGALSGGEKSYLKFSYNFLLFTKLSQVFI